jgi:hypothetical protein
MGGKATGACPLQEPSNSSASSSLRTSRERAESYQQIRVAGRDQEARAWPQHIEVLGILRAPQIVEYEQTQLAFEQALKLIAPFIGRRKCFRLTRHEAGQLTLQLQRLDRLAEGQPEDPVWERALGFIVIDQIDREHRLPDAAHSVQPDPPARAGDANRAIG